MSDIGHSRVLTKSQLFSFSAPSGCVFAVGCHTLLFFDILQLVYGELHCCKEVWLRIARVYCKYTSLAVKENIKGYPLAIHVQSKKLVAFSVVLLLLLIYSF